MLEVVEQEQERPVGQERRQRVGGGPVDAVEQAEGPGDRRGHQCGVGDAVERHEPGAVRQRRLAAPRELDREAGLADPAGSGQRHQPVVVEQPIERGEISRTPDERRQPVGQVAIGRTGDPDRWELGAQPGNVELEQVLGDRDVLERMPAQVADADAGRQRRFDERPRGLRQDDLLPVADGRDACATVDVEPAVVVAGKVCLARVEAHPDADVAALGPGVGRQRALCLDRGGDRGAGLAEGREHRIALGPDGDAVVGLDGAADHVQMRGVQRVPIRSERPGEPHRALDVGAQEGHRPGRERAPGRVAVGHRVGRYCCVPRRSARVASIAIAASGRSSRIDLSPAPPMTSPRTPSPSAMTVAARGASRRTASSPM